ncbi:MAG TPA: DUF4209 domain-containing protein [Candidatus Acidoferrales bacterium]|nr:DUF4209 domain-containing protein [Candidatus Acidoferrales bacterium]HVC23607.1 DUF4209 domain-containing protein [Candidatus Dormibacteraeota bacterium]
MQENILDLIKELDAHQDVPGSTDEGYRRELADLLDRVEQELGAGDPVAIGLTAETAVVSVPMPLGATRGGPRFPYRPRAQFLGDSALEWLADRVSASSSARVRSRLADFLWESTTGELKTAGLGAPQAYADFAGLLLGGLDAASPTGSLQVCDAVGRGWELARRMNQPAVASILEELAVQFIERALGDDLDFGSARHAASAVTVVARDLDASQRARALAGVLGCIERYEQNVVIPPLMTELIDARKALATDEEERRASDRRAAAYYAEFAARSSRPEVTPEYWRIAVLLGEQGQEVAERLNRYRQGWRRANEASGQSLRPLRLPLSDGAVAAVRRKAERLAQMGLADLLDNIGSDLVVSRVVLEELDKFQAANAPLTHRIPITVVAGAGQVVSPSGSESEHLMHLRMLHMQAGDVTLGELWSALKTRAGFMDEVKEYLRTCGLPQSNLELIDPALDTLWLGVAPLALHVLVPQLEDVLRELLRRAGQDTMQMQPNNRFTTLEVSLGTVLSGLVSTSVISQDEQRALEAVLDNAAGLNLRNRVGHGLVRFNELSEVRGARLVFLYLLVGRWYQRPM